MFLTKSHKFLEFSKSLSLTLKIQQFGYEYMYAVRCIREKRQMTKLEKVAISYNFNFRGWWCLFFCVPLQEQFAENTNKSYHVCRVIVVPHIYLKMFSIR